MANQDNLSPEDLKALQQARQIKELVASSGWQEVLLPHLQDRLRHLWVDPRKVNSDETLLYEYKVAWAFAQAAEEILGFVKEMEETFDYLTKKQNGEVIDKLRGE